MTARRTDVQSRRVSAAATEIMQVLASRMCTDILRQRDKDQFKSCKTDWNNILTHYFVSRIRHATKMPSICLGCNRANLKQDAVLATLGSSEATGDYVPSVLCLDCETLMIVTPSPDGVIGIFHSAGNQVTVRN